MKTHQSKWTNSGIRMPYYLVSIGLQCPNIYPSKHGLWDSSHAISLEVAKQHYYNFPFSERTSCPLSDCILTQDLGKANYI